MYHAMNKKDIENTYFVDWLLPLGILYELKKMPSNLVFNI